MCVDTWRERGMQAARGLWPTTSTLVDTATSWPRPPPWARHSYTPPSSGVMQPSTSLATPSPSPCLSPGCGESLPASLWPSLYQAVAGVGLPVAEQLRVRLPDTRAVTWDGGSS